MMHEDMDAVTRVEVIDDNGRSYARWNVFVAAVSIQDDGRTLKLFISPRALNQPEGR